jgi:hypothetical protein
MEKIIGSLHITLFQPFRFRPIQLSVSSQYSTGLYHTCTVLYPYVQYYIVPRGTTQLSHVVAESKCTKLYFYSVFVFCSGSIEVATLDLSGSNAATSSIFLNCQGNRDGYRNGRMSKPVGSKKKKLFSFNTEANDAKRQNNDTYGCHPGYTPPTRNTKPSEKGRKKRVTAYSMVRRCKRRHFVTVARVFKIEQFDLLSDLSR